MDQGKLEVVKQEIARVSVDILGISELRWTGMGKFNSDDHYIYYWGQESLRRNRVAIKVNKRVRNAVLGCNIKNAEWSLFISKANHSIMVIHVYAPTSNAETEAEQFYEDIQDLWELTKMRDVPFIIGDWNAKVGSQETPEVTNWPWSTEWSRTKANRVLPREHTGHSKYILPRTQEKTLHMDITRCPTPKTDWFILCSQKWRSSIQLANIRPKDDYGSDHELLIAKFRLKFKKVGKATRPLRYDLNQTPCNYTVEVRNRFKGLDLIGRVPDELCLEVPDIAQETGIKTIP